jgi:thiol-disulfide isomerase/thioredoxin
MKARLQTVLFLGLSFAGLATIALTGLSNRAESNQAIVYSDHSEMMPAPTAPTAPTASSEAAMPGEAAMLIAQAPERTALVAELQGRPTVVKIYADWCPACQRLRPITNELQQQFGDRVNFVVFDVTDRGTTQAAEARASQLGLSDFLAAHRAQTSTVAIINPGNGQVLTQFRYNFNQQDYVNGIERAIERVTANS